MEKFTLHSALADPNLKNSCWYKPSEIACAESLGLSMPVGIPGCPVPRSPIRDATVDRQIRRFRAAG